jgi:hypothetical protein
MGPENPQVVVDAPINFIIKLLRGQARIGVALCCFLLKKLFPIQAYGLALLGRKIQI